MTRTTRMIQAQHISEDLKLSAAERLVSAPGEKAAARRLVANARAHNIDLDMLWGAIGTTPDGESFVRQVCLAVLGAGKTAMLFMSSPSPKPHLGGIETQHLEISASVQAALQGLSASGPDRVTLAQTLIEPAHRWAGEVCADAGMTFVGRLEYLKRSLTPEDRNLRSDQWPAGIRVRTVDDVLDFSPEGDGTKLAAALDASYIDTLDCPELCGRRATRDVIASHHAAGAYNPNHWYIVELDHAPVGCCLLTVSPEQSAVELVYIGLGPTARGLGLGRKLLKHAISNLGDHGAKEITCAVDTRNTPALRVYASMGFSSFDARLGYIASV